jgi:hypothetical protein
MVCDVRSDNIKFFLSFFLHARETRNGEGYINPNMPPRTDPTRAYSNPVQIVTG